MFVVQLTPSVRAQPSPGDILVADFDAGTSGRGALFSVNPSTGARTVISDFGAVAQGPLGEGPVGLVVVLGPGVIQVQIDIPGCFNVNGHGVIPVAILGSDTFDVAQVDVSSLMFAGLLVRVRGNGNPQCSIADVSGDFTFPEGEPDGFLDLVCQFMDDPNFWNPGDGVADLAGSLLDGTPFKGTDSICLVP